MKVARGDRVRLTDAMADVMNRGLTPRPRKVSVQWRDRVGTVMCTPRCMASMIRIRFDDGSRNEFPIGALQHVDGPVL